MRFIRPFPPSAQKLDQKSAVRPFPPSAQKLDQTRLSCDLFLLRSKGSTIALLGYAEKRWEDLLPDEIHLVQLAASLPVVWRA
jgi:hypothetical protein